MVLWNLRFNSDDDTQKVRKIFKNAGMYAGTGNLTEVTKEPTFDLQSLAITAENKEQILSILGENDLTAKVLSRN